MNEIKKMDLNKFNVQSYVSSILYTTLIFVTEIDIGTYKGKVFFFPRICSSIRNIKEKR